MPEALSVPIPRSYASLRDRYGRQGFDDLNSRQDLSTQKVHRQYNCPRDQPVSLPSQRPMLTIRPAADRDHEAIWYIFRAVVEPGDSFVFDPETPFDEFNAFWFGMGVSAYVAEHDSRVVGSYILKANQPGLGSHVGNAAYMVAAEARGMGIGVALGEHSLKEASRLGYRALQFNIVVSTNEPAMRLWKRLGFAIVGTLPGAFRHQTLGFVDAHVMFQTLEAV
jgi:L-amino acid N-acyltransferase YncA